MRSDLFSDVPSLRWEKVIQYHPFLSWFWSWSLPVLYGQLPAAGQLHMGTDLTMVSDRAEGPSSAFRYILMFRVAHGAAAAVISVDPPAPRDTFNIKGRRQGQCRT